MFFDAVLFERGVRKLKCRLSLVSSSPTVGLLLIGFVRPDFAV